MCFFPFQSSAGSYPLSAVDEGPKGRGLTLHGLEADSAIAEFRGRRVCWYRGWGCLRQGCPEGPQQTVGRCPNTGEGVVSEGASQGVAKSIKQIRRGLCQSDEESPQAVTFGVVDPLRL